MLDSEASIAESFLNVTEDSGNEPPAVLARYRREALIGEGGIGRVYRAMDTVSAESVALKVMQPFQGEEQEVQRQYFHEIRALAAIEHQNVVPVLDHGESEGWPYVVMPLLEGQDLGVRLAEGPDWGIEERLAVARQVAAALAEVHAHGLVHGDVKPNNLFLETSGRVKLLDFGATRRRESLLESMTVTLGSPSYMAPEFLFHGRLSAPCDVFSFGVVVFELLCGEEPFPARNLAECFRPTRFDRPPIEKLRRAGVPDDVLRVIQSCINPNPEARPRSFAEIQQSLGDPSW